MAGLTDEGFIAATLEEIQTRMNGKLLAYDPEIDLDVASPDGLNVAIFSYEVSQLWAQLNLVYKSYDPRVASGQALRNIGLLTGLPVGLADRSQANVSLTGTAGTVVPRGSIVTDADDNEFQTSFAATIPSSVQVIASQAGLIPILAGAITTIKTVISGWTGVSQAADGVQGTGAQSAQKYRTLRNAAVMRNATGLADVVSGRLLELGLEQASVVNNDHPTDAHADGTPAKTLHVVVGEVGAVTDDEIAYTILNAKGLGCPTWSSTGNSTVVTDNQGVDHEIFYDKAIGVPIVANIEVTFLDEDTAGAKEAIQQAVSDHINGLLAGEDVVWSRLFALVTPYGKAQVDVLEIGKTVGTLASTNIAITPYEFTSCTPADVVVTET